LWAVQQSARWKRCSAENMARDQHAKTGASIVKIDFHES
jgi:hypothetical protein